MALVCLLALLQAPLVGLQSYAWVKMIWERSHAMGLREAVIDVAGGERPCEVCQFVSNQRTGAHENTSRHRFLTLDPSKRQPMGLTSLVALPARYQIGQLNWPVWFVPSRHRSESPPTPPPEWT